MDQMMVDVTDIPGVQPEDPVVLVGRDGNNEITMEEISAAADSFNYEFMCGISRRVPRYYCSQGQIVRSVYYLLAEE
jgi:alanine racemase